MVLRHVAPAGAPIRSDDLVRWWWRSATTTNATLTLKRDIARRFGAPYVFVTNTGRAGMTLLLSAMRTLAPQRDEVILPSYTCYSVAASVIKAGLRPRVVDVSPRSLDFEEDRLRDADFSRVLALIATNLYGIPSNVAAWSRLAADRGAFFIDDAAQAMGAAVEGRASGTWGDAGLFSFDKGKNVSAIDGGIVVTGSERLATALDVLIQRLPAQGLRAAGVHTLKVLAYFAMLRPWLYGIPARLPQLGLGRTVFSTDFPLARPDPLLEVLSVVMLRRLDGFTRARRENAERLLAGLRDLPGIDTIAAAPASEPVYLRLPVIMSTRYDRDRSVDALTRAGVGATGSYPRSLPDVPEVAAAMVNRSETFPGGRHIADRILTLPTHPFVDERTIRRALAEIRRGVQHPCAA